MELAKAYRSENAKCRQGLDGGSQCLRRTYCVWGSVPCAEECSMNNADENPYQPGGTGVFGLQFKHSGPRKSGWVEFDQTSEGVREWTVPIPGRERSRWRGQCTTAPRLHGLEGKRHWLCSGTYLQSDLGLPHLSEWRVGLDPIGRWDPLRMFRWSGRCQCRHHWDTHTESPVTQGCVSFGHRGSITTQRKLQFCEKWARVFFQHVLKIS